MTGLEPARVEVGDMVARVRSLAVGERLGATAGLREQFHLLLGCVLDPETGERAFGPEQIDWLLSEAPAGPVDRMVGAALAASGLGDDAEADAGKRLLGLADSNGEVWPQLAFVFSLAESLHMTVGDICTRMSSWELTHWIAWARIKAEERAHEEQRAKQKRSMRRRARRR